MYLYIKIILLSMIINPIVACGMESLGPTTDSHDQDMESAAEMTINSEKPSIQRQHEEEMPPNQNGYK